MPAEKITGIVVGCRPYRESSLLLTLLSEQAGLVRGIAKGIKRQKPTGLFLERGFLCELLLYRKPGRDLHTLAGIAVLDFFGEIRMDLLKSAVRDAALEAIEAGVGPDEAHAALFGGLLDLCKELRLCGAPFTAIAQLWQFYYDFARHLGFAPDLCTCLRCGKPIDRTEGCCLITAQGQVSCPQCRTAAEASSLIPSGVLSGFHTGRPDLKTSLSAFELRRITSLLADYCRYHCDLNFPYKSLAFLNTILE
ncbi:MAG: DNA repair protein RecO [Chitinivibrionales bacterium]|nr:DNA repair protein RecO [Chitinivibrionales bacterium]